MANQQAVPGLLQRPRNVAGEHEEDDKHKPKENSYMAQALCKRPRILDTCMFAFWTHCKLTFPALLMNDRNEVARDGTPQLEQSGAM